MSCCKDNSRNITTSGQNAAAKCPCVSSSCACGDKCTCTKDKRCSVQCNCPQKQAYEQAICDCGGDKAMCTCGPACQCEPCTPTACQCTDKCTCTKDKRCSVQCNCPQKQAHEQTICDCGGDKAKCTCGPTCQCEPCAPTSCGDSCQC